MDQPGGQRAYEHQEAGSWRGRGDRNQRGGYRGRGYDGGGGTGRGYDRGGNRQYNRGNDRQSNQWNKRDNYRQDNRQYNQEEKPQRSGFGKPSYHQGPNVQQQEDMTQGQNNFNDRARPKDKNHDDHMRDPSPDRQDRSRPKDKNDEDHTRDPSPDRSLPEHCVKENPSSSTDATTQNQSQQVQNTVASDSQGMNINQQGFDNRNMEMDAQQGQGQVFYNKNQRGQDYRHQHNNGGRGQQQQGYYEKWDNSQGQGRDHQHQRYNRNQDGFQNQERGQQHRRYDDRRDGYGRGQRYQGHSDYNDSYQQGQGYNRGGYQQNDDRRQQRSRGEKSDFQLSKSLSYILRHGAERQGYKMMPGGFLYVEDILKKQNNLRDYDLEDVQRIVETNDKQRFHMEPDKETGKMKIRANQGHTIEVEDLELKPLLSANEVSMVIHGTYYTSWEKIKHTGLSRMGRNHIHFAAGEPGENGVISGMRQSCEVMIFINLQQALEDGFKFFRSANNVILCAGNEDGVIPPKYFVDAVQRYPRQRLEFDKTVQVVKVPIGGASLVQDGKGKKKKNKKSKGDREKEDGTETQKKKDKTEIDETAVEDTAQMFNEKMEVDAPTGSKVLNVDMSTKSEALNVNAAIGSGALGKLKDDYPNTPPDNWDEDKFVDAVQDQEPEEEYVDAQGSGPDVIVESNEEIITIDEPENSVSAVDYLMEKDMVAVHVETSDDGLQRISCVTEDKSYIFEVENNPYLMTSGKVAEFFNWIPEPKGPFKVFHGLDSKTCAVFFDKYDIILDGTKIYDLKIAYDMMKEGSFGDMDKLKKTGFSPDCIPVEKDNVTAVCLPYLKAYKYFSKEVNRELKDYKKYLFKMVNAKIEKDDMKKLKERKKKESKAANKSQSSNQGQTNKSQSNNQGQTPKSKKQKKK
ncbi:uncharacterized protein LOC127699109 [Mytilus californianus]|uniref:uncharacterized protein LOC127699109 n=1 Tax=Mytilus californianus TaxID=6549 RepID=UPI002245F1FD|nr:uncharacterized protein LOC127699109 [Mytilus californianus]